MIGIYKITSPIGRVYIGQSTNINVRFNFYKKLKCKGQIRLYNSFKKHGVDNHKFEVIEECVVDRLNERERYWQDHYDVLGKKGLNCKLTTTETLSGKHSKLTKIKIGIGNKGKKRTDEYKSNMSIVRKGKHSGSDHFLYGKKMDKEWRKKLSDAKSNGKHHLFGKKLSKSWIDNISKGQIGKMVDFENKKALIVLNLETGIYYESISFAAKCHNIKKTTLTGRLKGYRKNKTNMILV